MYVDTGAGPRYFGIYTMSEVPAAPMLDVQFGRSSGNLYKPEGVAANWAPRSLVSISTFRASFEKENNTGAADWSDVEEQRLNVDAFLRWMAANAVLGNGDAYGFIAHNHYLYGDPADSVPRRLRWIPWDHDRAMSCANLDVMYPAAGYTTARWPLFRYLLDDSQYRAAYIGHVNTFLASPTFDTAALNTRMDTALALLRPYVTGSEAEALGTRYSSLDSGTQFESAQTQLRDVLSQRRAIVPAMLVP